MIVGTYKPPESPYYAILTVLLDEVQLKVQLSGVRREGQATKCLYFGGEGEIRTHESREGLPVFKTGAFNRSATSPALRGLNVDFTGIPRALPDSK